MQATATDTRKRKPRAPWYRVRAGEPAHMFRNGVSACGRARGDVRYAFAIPSWMVTAHDDDLCRQCVMIARKFDLIEED